MGQCFKNSVSSKKLMKYKVAHWQSNTKMWNISIVLGLISQRDLDLAQFLAKSGT